MIRFNKLWIAVTIGLLASPVSAQQPLADPLPAWNDGPAKQRLVDFVHRVTDAESETFVAPLDRIATFDNDGTLWCEKPTYVQMFFIVQRLKSLADSHPQWKTTQPYRAVLQDDPQALDALGWDDWKTLVFAAQAGMTQDQFEGQVKAFFATTKQPRWQRPFTEMVYVPQLQLMEYLRSNDFRVFIVTGGGRDFVRGVSEAIYQVPQHMVVGSSLQTRFEVVDNRAQLLRLPQFVEPLDDGLGKPVCIERDIGRRPILAFGNSDGDIQMLQYAESDERPWLSLLLHHDDPVREYAYNKGTEQALKIAAQRGWTVVSIKDDFRRVFAFED